MAATPQELSHDVLAFVREGIFPSSDAVLTSEVTSEAATSILNTISDTKSELEEEIKRLSKTQASDVDDWIRQAKQVQQDIADCKVIAREIVQEHEKGCDLEATARDAQAKAQLLSGEIKFSTALQCEMEEIGSLNQTLIELESQVAEGSVVEAASGLNRLRALLSQRRPTRVNDFFQERSKLVSRKCNEALRHNFSAKLAVQEDDDAITLIVKSDIAGESGLCRTLKNLLTPSDPTRPSMERLLVAAQDIDSLDMVTESTANKIEKAIITPFLMTKPKWCISVRTQGNSLELKIGLENPGSFSVLENAQVLFEYLHRHLPGILRLSIAGRLVPRMISHIRTTWLDESVPFDIAQLDEVRTLQAETLKLANLLDSYGWPGAHELLNWCDRTPEIWLTRRKMLSLQAVRRAVNASTGNLREVEHVEKQILQRIEPGMDVNTSNPIPETSKNQNSSAEEDDTSGWDFDDDDEDKDQRTVNGGQENPDEQEAEDAWGWDDDETAPKPSSKSSINGGTKLNGDHSDRKHQQEITLVERFKITDIPDHLLEIIGRDLTDAKTIKESPSDVLASISPSESLLSMPAIVLAMFRAIAPTIYIQKLTSGNMQLYNDSMFVAQKLRSSGLSTVAEDIALQCRIMEKFANSAYAREIETQRTILGDLLDGAQGFVHCTQPPNSTECENAIAAVVDRVRAVHDTWKGILSNLTLLQAMGKLLSTLVSKIIRDVEDMDDISEPQSQRLTSLFNRIKSLEDIFTGPALDLPTLVGGATKDQEILPRTATYCADWFRFTYLIDILDSGLTDIKYMWTHGMLGYEYSQDEVIDLVKALFSDTQFRKNFIHDIRRIPPGSGIQE